MTNDHRTPIFFLSLLCVSLKINIGQPFLFEIFFFSWKGKNYGIFQFEKIKKIKKKKYINQKPKKYQNLSMRSKEKMKNEKKMTFFSQFEPSKNQFSIIKKCFFSMKKQ